MKQLILYIIFYTFSIQLSAQVGIGTSTPHASAKLEVSSTTQGFLPPRMTAAQRVGIQNPTEGLFVYQIDVTAGLYYYSGSQWIYIINSANTLPVANGGTGATTLTGILKGNGTSAFTTATAGTDYLAPNGSAANLTNFPTLNQNTTGTAANVSGTVLIANGGTGATTQQEAINALSGTQASGKYLRSDGTNTTLSSLGAADITGTLAVANGGSGATTLTGILKGNGTNAFSAAVPGTDYQAALTNPVTGTGTSNYLPKFTGSTTIGNTQIFDNATSVGIGGNTPNASAKLDVSSTTQGFLPPRMTYAQRAAIANPAQGLVVYCTNCGNNGELQVYNGSSWTNVAGGATQVGIGQSAYGGKVAYIFQPGDPGFVSGEIHGIVASNDEWTAGWGCNGTALAGANGTGIGTGAQNTIDIVGGCAESGIAARICDDYSIASGGITYSDWHLPSITELQRILANRQAIGGFNSPYILYWSSSQNGNIFAYCIRTDNPGTDFVTNKSGGDYGIGVRAVRFF